MEDTSKKNEEGQQEVKKTTLSQVELEQDVNREIGIILLDNPALTKRKLLTMLVVVGLKYWGKEETEEEAQQPEEEEVTEVTD